MTNQEDTITIRVRKDLHDRLKIRAVKEDKKLYELVSEIIEGYLEQKGEGKSEKEG